MKGFSITSRYYTGGHNTQKFLLEVSPIRGKNEKKGKISYPDRTDISGGYCLFPPDPHNYFRNG